MEDQFVPAPTASDQAGGSPPPSDPSAEAVSKSDSPDEGQYPVQHKHRVLLPAVLFAATCLSTFWAGATHWLPSDHFFRIQPAARTFADAWQQRQYREAFAQGCAVLRLDWRQGCTYMLAVMAILLTHEMGHFILARRRNIPATLPFFIPLPIYATGTLGAVIELEGSEADRKRIFDLGIAGPLAGLALALPITWLGIRQLNLAGPMNPEAGLPCPLIFQILVRLVHPGADMPAALQLNHFNPLLMAGWVGMLVTGMNMLPISQLDGGHVAHALLGSRARLLARGLLVAGIAWVLVKESYVLVPLLVLVTLLGVDHPPTADDGQPLNWPRRVLGWSSMIIPVLCFPLVRAL